VDVIVTVDKKQYIKQTKTNTGNITVINTTIKDNNIIAIMIEIIPFELNNDTCLK